MYALISITIIVLGIVYVVGYLRATRGTSSNAGHYGGTIINSDTPSLDFTTKRKVYNSDGEEMQQIDWGSRILCDKDGPVKSIFINP